MSFGDIFEKFYYISGGVFFTLELLFLSLLIGIFLSFFMAIFRKNKILKIFINTYVSVIRGTPLLLQLSIIYFGTKGLSVLLTGSIAFGLNSAAYLAEIFRAGIEAIPIGQFEAALTLQIPKFYMWRDVIIPQLIRNIFPAFVNEVIALLKETAIISAISGSDIMQKASILGSRDYIYFESLIIAGFFYYSLTFLITKIGNFIEGKLSYGKNN